MIDIWGYGRHTGELFICCMFLYFYQKQKIFILPLIINSLACLLIVDRNFYL